MSATVCASVLVRALAIWIFRPEFTGWFNHTAYYFVQVRGIIENGAMPFSDLPFLFWMYAAAAQSIALFGVTIETAVVSSTRLGMVLLPALTAIPAYFLIRSVSNGAPFSFSRRLLVAASAFLPLNLVHMPELLQKNVLGVFLLGWLMYAFRLSIERITIRRVAALLFLTVLISISHFGTLAAAVLFAGSIAIAMLLVEGGSRKSVAAVLAAGGSAVLSPVILWVAVPERFGRLIEYTYQSLSNSLAGRLVLEGTLLDKSLYLAGIVIPALVLVFLIRSYRRATAKLDKGEAVFLTANAVFAYMLAAPFIDTALIPRLLLFLPLPAIVLAAGLLEYGKQKRLSVLPTAAIIAASAIMMSGEIVGVMMTNGSDRETEAELKLLARKGILAPDDLIVTTYGINPVCNWFLGTKASDITSFDKTIFAEHRKVFVLKTDSVPEDWSDVDSDGDGMLDDAERYSASRRSIRLSHEAISVYKGGSFELFEIRSLPDNWKFDPQGNWIGYR